VKLWESRSGRLLSSLDGHSEPIMSVAFDRSGRRLVTASSDRSVRIWSLGTSSVSAGEFSRLVEGKVPYRVLDGVLVRGEP
jgi:WD40 repeat protein